jgi:hypothetical protein
MDTQWICDPERVPNCRCAGDDGKYSCDCTEPNIAGNCDLCGSPMVWINVNTGEPVGEAKAS